MADWPVYEEGQLWAQGEGVSGDTPVLTNGINTATLTAAVVASLAGSEAGKGVPKLVFTATRNYSGFLLQVFNRNSVFTTRSLLDLSWDSAAANVFAANIYLQAPNTAAFSYALYMPIAIPSGASIYARAWCLAAAGTVNVLITGVAGGGEGYSRCQTIGVDATNTNSFGTAISRGIQPAEGSWTALANAAGAQTTGEPIRAVILLLGNRGGQDATVRWFWDIALGSPQTVVLEDLITTTTLSADTHTPQVYGPIPLSIPALTQIYARVSTSITSTITSDIALLGFS